MIIKLINNIKNRHIYNINKENELHNNIQYQKMMGDMDAEINAFQKAAIR